MTVPVSSSAAAPTAQTGGRGKVARAPAQLEGEGPIKRLARQSGGMQHGKGAQEMARDPRPQQAVRPPPIIPSVDASGAPIDRPGGLMHGQSVLEMARGPSAGIPLPGTIGEAQARLQQEASPKSAYEAGRLAQARRARAASRGA
ncbi:hypothetical protein [Citreimonas sp.]|uniref:hypothetical protein n=1 Tax=Citreimonas sp. TaxID=3036715 RepID=UPI0035C7BA66